MTTISQDQTEASAYPSYDELRKEGVYAYFAPATKRLFWPLAGEYPTALAVMKTPTSSNDLEPYATSTGNGNEITLHEISQLPITEPKISSIEASVQDLEQWEFDWIAWHGAHEGEPYEPEYVTYGDLSDDDRPFANDAKEDGSWEEDSDTDFLINCCGDERPLRKRGLKVVVNASRANGFVTIDDYVRTVHPWLMSLREDILKAKKVGRPQYYPAAESMGWMVGIGPQHQIEEKEGWMRDHGPPPPMDASTNAILNMIRADRNR